MRVFAVIFLICVQFSASAQNLLLSGKVTDSKNNPLPFASVFVKGTTIGTNTNADGIYNLRLKEGNYEIVYQYVGYKKEIKSVELNSNTSVNVILQSDNYQLKEVEVKAGEDPAYAVIRQAIKKRRFYLNQVD